MSAGLHSDSVVELLMLTAAQESHCGRYIEQINGPARGIFQMEPESESDVFKNYLKYRPELLEIVQEFIFPHHVGDLNLRANLPYQIVIARCMYQRFSEPLPDAGDIKGLAEYWKKYWNTPLGAGTVVEAIENYRRYAVEV